MKNIRLAVILIASLGLVLGGCSGDEVKGNGETEDQTVNGGEGDAGSDAEGDSGGEDTGDAGEEGGGEGDAGDAGEEDEEVLEFPDVEPVGCAYPDESPECEQGDYGPASFFRKLELARGSCCADVNGNGQIDNLLGPAMNIVQIMDYDINEAIEVEIEHGGLIYLLETANWTHPEWDSEIDLYIHEATAIHGQTMDPILEGEGGVYLAPWSIADGTSVRRYGFERAYVHDGTLYATGGTFQIRFPGLLDAIDARMERMSIEAKVVQDPAPEMGAGGGFYLEDGKIGGAVVRDALFESLNEAAQDCQCMGDDFELFIYNEGHDRWDCGIKGSDEMDCGASTMECRAFAERTLCQALQVVSARPDVVLDDGSAAFSVGMTFEGMPVKIMGIHDW